jgi:ribonuclease HI
VLINGEGNEVVRESTFPGYKTATNNQMELQAPILALREAKRLGLTDGLSKIIVHTDSMYVCDNYKRAMFTWPRTGWSKRGGAPVLNAELWKELIRLIRSMRCIVEFRWVKGHSKDPHNKAVDKLAKQSASHANQSPLAQVSVRRKRTKQKVEPGGVKMRGQRLTIRVITCEYLRVQQVWKYKYEVLSKASPFFGKVDWIYSSKDLLVRDGHHYHVRLNEDQSYPQIMRVFREIER